MKGMKENKENETKPPLIKPATHFMSANNLRTKYTSECLCLDDDTIGE